MKNKLRGLRNKLELSEYMSEIRLNRIRELQLSIKNYKQLIKNLTSREK